MDLKISQNGKPTSNRSKPIRVLTRTKSLCSDDRLPLGYLLPDFQPHRSNFVIHFTSLHFTPMINFSRVDPSRSQLRFPGCRRPGRKGVDTGETRALGLLCQFPLLAISAYNHVTCCRNLSRFEATFFWPTNKDSIHKKHFKPIGLLMWVKKL